MAGMALPSCVAPCVPLSLTQVMWRLQFVIVATGSVRGPCCCCCCCRCCCCHCHCCCCHCCCCCCCWHCWWCGSCPPWVHGQRTGDGVTAGYSPGSLGHFLCRRRPRCPPITQPSPFLPSPWSLLSLASPTSLERGRGGVCGRVRCHFRWGCRCVRRHHIVRIVI